MTTPSPTQDTESLIKEFLAYPFHEDMTFLEGLQLLLGQPVVETFQRGGPTSAELEQSLLGPKLFFFNRQRNTNLTPELVQEYTQARPQTIPQPSLSAPTSPSAALVKTPDEDQQLSLAELTRLIETGQTHLIPHNYVIPDGVQTVEPGPPQAPVRKKPWETTNTMENDGQPDSPMLPV